MTTVNQLLNQVVAPGFCVGCGACASLDGSPLGMELDDKGRYRPVLGPDADGGHVGPYTDVCPFASGRDEDFLAAQSIVGSGASWDSRIGNFRSLLAGHVRDQDARSRSSSGGLTTWFVAKLLEDDLVDAVLHVRSVPEGDPMYAYAVSETLDEVQARAKTRYYPIEMSQVLSHVREHDRRYAVVGLPCLIKAIRLLQAEDPVFKERVKYCVGLVCGHLKSTGFAEALAWEAGVPPSELHQIEFRAKTDVAADAYDIVATDHEGNTHRRRNSSLLASDWGMGMFKYRACDFCDDVTAETADISLGDAWLPSFRGDPKGTNVVVVRSSGAQQLVRRHQSELNLEELTADDIARSQAAGLRHRREGLAYRLAQEQKAGRPVPPKRVKASSGVPRQRARIYDLRTQFIDVSDAALNGAKREGDWGTFVREISPWIVRYREAYSAATPLKSLVKRKLPGFFRVLKNLKNRLHR